MSRWPAAVGVDWGNTRLRAWAFDQMGGAQSPYRSDDGASTGEGDLWARLERHFSTWLGGWPAAPVVVCGAVGGESGFGLAPYVDRLPTGGDLLRIEQDGRSIWLTPGLKQGFPPDVMRGEETLLVGLDAPDGLICLPGTHVKHVECVDGAMAWSKTSPVGELRALLLRDSTVKPPDGVAQVFDDAVFDRWAERALDLDLDLSVFAVRAARLLDQLRPEHVDAALTALLVGRDLAATYEPGDEVLLVGAGPLSDAYEDVFDLMGVETEVVNAEDAARAGLWRLAHTAGLVREAA